MKRDYFNFKFGNSKIKSGKQFLLGLVMMLFASFGYSQETMTITTTSNDSNWVINFTNSGGAALSWLATGPGLPPLGLTGTGNNPSFDFSGNVGNGDITIEITSPDNFDFVTVLLAPGREISDIDLTNLENLVQLEMPTNQLMDIDLEFNTALQRLDLDNNQLTSVDISNNVNLITFDASFNELNVVDVDGIPNLVFMDLSNNELTTINLSGNNQLTQINLDFNLLTTTAIGQVIDQVDAYGTGGFGHILSLTGNPGDIPASSIDSVNNLLGRDWIVRPPVIYDFGDAPDSYATTNGNGGAQHIIGDGDLYLGSVYDDELDGFPGVDADGDDNDKVADEDGVDPADLVGISTSTDNFSVDVEFTNNTGNASNIYAWIDFDMSGTFDADEYTTTAIPANTAGSVTLTWSDLIANGVDIVEGDSYARFRTTSDVLTENDPGGIVNNGEVEDYFVPIELDTDGDGVPDSADLDADNDGILNTDEPGDSNSNGVDDSLELDSDGDGCFDTLEAGVLDGDGDGYVGTGILTSANVDADGLVISDDNGAINSPADAYGPLNDLNGNSILDSQEVGAPANITTQPVDQDLIIGDVTFTVVTDLAPGDESYQWEESTDSGATWTTIIDAVGSYAGAQTASLVVTNTDVSRLTDRYRVLVSNVAYACDPVSISDEVTYITPEDFDLDGIFDIVDVDDDNDGIFDVDEAGNTDPGTNEDRINLDADSDGCFDVTEAGFTDDNGDGILGNTPVSVNPDGSVSSGTDGYTTPNDLNGSGTPDFQEVGAPANITTQPVEQEYVQSGTAVFSVVTDLAAGDEFYQWQEDSGSGFVDIIDGPDFTGTNTADLTVTIPANFDKVFYTYRVIVANVAYACDPRTTSAEVGFVIPGDFDRDGVFDIDDLDDDNDGILDTDEDNGVVDRDTDGDGSPDKRDFDADDDGCFDTLESGVLDGDSNGLVGTGIITSANVDADGLVVSDANGAINSPGDAYGPLNDLDGNGTPDFQEEGFAASITADPTDQDFILGGSATFTATAIADTYQWQFSTDGGANWTDVIDDANNAGATTNTLVVSNLTINEYDNNTYRLVAEYISFVCDDVPAESLAAGFNTLADFDGDTVPDVVDVDDDNDGILDSDEAGNTDPSTNPDALNLDADGDGCYDVTEAGFTDNGMGMLGTANPPVVDGTGLVTSATDGYTTPNDLDNNGTPDFQEAGSAATITSQPADQNFVPGGAVTFDVVASADTYQWEESTDGTTWNDVADGGDYSGATTASLTVSNVNVSMLGYAYRVRVNNIAFACDPVTTSDAALIVSLPDNDNDGVPDIVDVDDDNDGIFDTVEDAGPNGGDSNNNTIPDRFELDADSDGCDDVVEAGFTDDDGDGLLGNSPVTVDPLTGQVTSGTDGYTTPNDLDNNGTFDFQETGSAANITGDPVDQDFVLNGTATYTATSDGDTYQWEISADGVNFTPLGDDSKYSGTTTASLTVSGLVIPDYFNEYRVVVRNISFACDPGDASASASFNILLDTDNDGVFDIVDVDDDNDGIFDTVEGEVTDSNLDGRPDRISLDSDSDGCADAIEAGFTDPDGDGILGTSPVTVDADGQVTGQGGYTTPNDLDNNGVFDFQEAGEPSAIENQPEEIEIALGDDAIFEVSATATFFQWQQSMDDGNTWVDLVNDIKYSGVDTDRLRINDARGRLEGSRYRVILTSPDFACDPNDELISDGVRLVFNTELIPSGFSPNGDGENDLFSIPGLIETPNFSMEVFDRWGNSVYKYKNNGSLNPDWWDGKSTGNMTLSKGQLVPAGTYFYLIEYNDGNKSPDKGWVYVNY